MLTSFKPTDSKDEFVKFMRSMSERMSDVVCVSELETELTALRQEREAARAELAAGQRTSVSVQAAALEAALRAMDEKGLQQEAQRLSVSAVEIQSFVNDETTKDEFVEQRIGQLLLRLSELKQSNTVRRFSGLVHGFWSS